MYNNKNIFYGILIIIFTVVSDQLSKFYVFNILIDNNPPIIILTGFLRFVMVYNEGVSFGLFDSLANGRLILTIITLSITLVLFIWLLRVKQTYLSCALGLIIGGAIGNIIDRIRIGAVADFIDFHINDFHWPAFNLADSYIFIGVAILFILQTREDLKKNKENKNVENN